MTQEGETQILTIILMIIIIKMIITTWMWRMKEHSGNLMMDSTHIDPLEKEEDLDPCTIQGEKVPETLVMLQEIREETPQEIVIETGKGMEGNQTGVSAEKEGEEMELSELENLIMGSQVDPEGVARRPNVWWGLL